ncbi:hypothetical protein [Gordonia sp. CPCC 205333]|uniref:hypothetical protein n=1 Tax=Gordonia sp. CPCC 205333 TaxID=3140790 RepID=UPI003AF33D49
MTPQPNPGDYVPLGKNGPLPQVTTPRTADADKNGVATQGITIVQMEEQAWRARAEVASWAAEELRECKLTIAKVLQHNYFGAGCLEGAAVYDALRESLKHESGWARTLGLHICDLEQLAATSMRARSALSATDNANQANLIVST